MKTLAFTGYGCRLSPHCQLDIERVDLLNQIFVYGIAGAAGLMITVLVVVYVVLKIREAVAKVRQLLGMA